MWLLYGIALWPRSTAVEECLATVLQRLNTVREQTVCEAAELIREPEIEIPNTATLAL